MYILKSIDEKRIIIDVPKSGCLNINKTGINKINNGTNILCFISWLCNLIELKYLAKDKMTMILKTSAGCIVKKYKSSHLLAPLISLLNKSVATIKKIQKR